MQEIILDVSTWNKKMDYALLKDSGVQGIIIKAGGSGGTDPMLRVHHANARAAGMAVGFYYWVDPLRDGRTQAHHLLDLADELGPDFLAGDVEQWWADWELWRRFTLHKIPLEDVPRLSAQQINRVAKDFFTMIKPSQRTILFYSSTSFVAERSPLLKEWAFDYPLWIAQYPRTGGSLAAATLSWDELKEKFLPSGGPRIPAGWPRPLFWQWSGDRFTLPGHQGEVDLNWFLGEDFFQWAGGLPKIQPLPFDVRHLKAGVGGLNVRAQPNPMSEILRVIVPGEEIHVEKGQTGIWRKLFGEAGFIHSGFIE